MRASANGTVLVGHGGGWAGLEFATFARGKQTGTKDSLQFRLGAFALPTPDGQSIYTPKDIFAVDGSSVSTPTKSAYFVPAHEPDHVLALNCAKPLDSLSQVSKAHQPITSVNVYENNKKTKQFGKCPELNFASEMAWDKRCHYYPSRQLLVSITDTRIVVRQAPK